MKRSAGSTAAALALASLPLAGTLGCLSSPVPAEELDRIRMAFGVPEAVGALRLADGEVSATSATFRYEEIGGPARAWVIRFPLDEREQRPKAFLDLAPILAEISEGKADFRLERRTQILEPDGREVRGEAAEFTFREGDRLWRGKVAVDLARWRRARWASVVQVTVPGDVPTADLDRLIGELSL